jgi:2-(1,2-epoxy-1,2-dihydrophenyl)acetyl-CoA isomerase
MAELMSLPDGPVHRLVLNRPARRNALTPEIARGLAQEIEQIEETGQARVILLSGAGGHFCAGLDLRWLESLGATPPIADLQRGLSDFQSAVIAIVRCPIPVLAVVQGTAAGFGFDLSLACDMRLAGTSLRQDGTGARWWLHLHAAPTCGSGPRAPGIDD